MPVSYLMKHGFRSSQNNYALIPKQKVWFAILVILTSAIMANEKDLIKLDVLACLRYTDRVTDQAQGSLGLAYAYWFFNNVS